MGLVCGKIFRQVYLGAVAGAVMAVYWSSKPNSRPGNFTRISGKLAVISAYKIRALWQELVLRWRAWNVYKRAYKEFESFDKK
jgi:hypothetical protein